MGLFLLDGKGLPVPMETLACFVHTMENGLALLPAAQWPGPVTAAPGPPSTLCSKAASHLLSFLRCFPHPNRLSCRPIKHCLTCFKIGTHSLQSEFRPCLSALGDLGRGPWLHWVSVYLKRAEGLSPVPSLRSPPDLSARAPLRSNPGSSPPVTTWTIPCLP